MSTLHTYDCEQRSDEWHELRRGVVTASAISALLTTEKPDALEVVCPDCGADAGFPCKSKRKPHAAISTVHPPRTAVVATMPARLTVADNEASRGLTLALVAERITDASEDGYLNADMIRGIEEEPRAREK